MTIGTLLVLLGLIIALFALVGAFAGNRWGGYSVRGVALAVFFVALGVLLGAHGFIKT